ncbi:MAG: SDR family NAD(P)-dependent oxidoreductase [Chloroflexota bacterium]
MSKEVLVTGGAGFIGCNLVDRLLDQGHRVTVLDDLSRDRVEENIAWLEREHGRVFELVKDDVRDFDAVRRATCRADVIFHLAAQVAVTTSVLDPRADFQVNALGTLNVLEAARQTGRSPIVIFASTNKVYGAMDDVEIVDHGTRYAYGHLPLGVPESAPLDFHSPYGCSKGAADQYVRDYFRIYGLRTVVFRQSCIYGPHQFGMEDQGWVAWFMIAAVTGKPITIYGDGKQVRDILYISDLLDAYEAAIQYIDSAAGQVYNIGGGPENTLAVWSEFGPVLARFIGREVPVTYHAWRPGDQKVYISDISKAARDLRWRPKVSCAQGLELLFDWIQTNKERFT